MTVPKLGKIIFSEITMEFSVPPTLPLWENLR